MSWWASYELSKVHALRYCSDRARVIELDWKLRNLLSLVALFLCFSESPGFYRAGNDPGGLFAANSDPIKFVVRQRFRFRHNCKPLLPVDRICVFVSWWEGRPDSVAGRVVNSIRLPAGNLTVMDSRAVRLGR